MEEGQASAIVENVEKRNEEIDIYVFSNGQQYSPPRKYHLRTEELNCWEATLSFLARSQYGSLHSSIELFELDGRKLDNPTDIRDCAVYVAVVPPDAFIYAGYDKYLVKASRSYERRFSKIINCEQTGTDENSRTQDVNNTPVKGSEIGPQYLTIRKVGEVRKSSLKNSSQKLMDKIKPVANQVSQRQPRKSNINSTDHAIKKIYNSKRDGPKYSSKINTTPGIPSKSSTSGRGGSIIRPKSPAKTLSFDTSIYEENDTHQKLETSKNESFTINKINQDSSLKPIPSSFKSSKLNNIASAIKKDGSILPGTRNSIVNEILSHHLVKPSISMNNLKKSGRETPKPTIKQRNSPISKMSPVIVDDKLQPTKKDRISWTDAIKLPMIDKMQGPSVRPIPTSTTETSSVTEQIQVLTSNEQTSTANTMVSKMVKELNDRLNAPVKNGIPKATNTNQMSIVSENKLTATEDFMLLNNNQSHAINKTIESIENQIVIGIPNDLHTSSIKDVNPLTTKPFISVSDDIKEINSRDRIFTTKETVLVSQENLLKDQNCVHNVTKSPTVLSKLLTAKSIDMDSSIFEDVPDQDNKNNTLINKTRSSKRDDIVKTNLDLISILNETRMSTEPQSFILKSEEARGSKSKERFIIINDTIDQIIKPSSNHNFIMQKSRALAVYETTKTNTDPKINVSKVEAPPKHEYIDISNVNQENKLSTRKSILHTNELQINSKHNSSIVPENVRSAYHDKTHKLKAKSKDKIEDEDMPNNSAFPSTNEHNTPDTNITIRTEDLDSTKTHSFTFYIKKDSDNNVKVTDIKSNLRKEMVKIPITNIVKDKDIVHINIFRSSTNDSKSMCTDATNEKPCEIQKCKDEDNNDMEDDCPSECNQCPECIPPKETDMTTTFMNPAWNNNTNVALKTSNNNNSDEIESDTDQFIAIVQNGDIVNLKLSIQIKDAAGILKSSHKITMHNSSSVNLLPSDEISKTPNELTRSKSLQSGENDSPPHLCCRKKDKIVIYQCACCENTNFTVAANSLNPSLQGLYVLLPVVAPVQESVNTRNQTSDKQVQHTESLTKVSVVSSVKETLLTFPGDNVQGKTSESSSKRQVLIEDQETIQSQLIMVRTEPSQVSSRNMESKVQQTNRTTQDQFTQTDWCDVLLEARAEPDGHYTFYLPPLHLLQQYSLR